MMNGFVNSKMSKELCLKHLFHTSHLLHLLRLY